MKAAPAFLFVQMLISGLASLVAQTPSPLLQLLTTGQPPFGQGVSRDLALGDLDGDGDLDLILGTYGGPGQVLLNQQGILVATDPGRLPWPAYEVHDIALGDVDADGDLDLVVGAYREQNRLLRNDGNAGFTDASSCLPALKDATNAIALGDVDGDGDLDLVVANYREPNQVLLNDGKGCFTVSATSNLPNQNDHNHSVALGDLDGDGDLDLILGDGLYPMGHFVVAKGAYVHLNDGTGTFTSKVNLNPSSPSAWIESLALGDLDRDGDLDLLMGNYQYNWLYLNDGKGNFTDVTQANLGQVKGSPLVLADVDRDGDLDLLAGNGKAYMNQNRIYVNDGGARFTLAGTGQPPANSDETRALAAGDLDGDLFPDLVVGNEGWDRLYLNDGKGGYGEAARRLPFPEETFKATCIAWGDIDGDGAPDLTVGCMDSNTPLPNRLYLNDGRGWFSNATQGRIPAVADNTSALALGDVDRDGDLDLLVGNLASGITLDLNDGKGFFTDVTKARMPKTDLTVCLAVGDLDGDGDLDLLMGVPKNTYSIKNMLLLNDGRGYFTDGTAGRLPPDSDQAYAMALGDLEGDGDLDLVIGGYGMSLLLLNDGTGRFNYLTLPGQTTAATSICRVGLADADGDGDLDLAVASRNSKVDEQLQLFSNLTRQLHVPLFGRLGCTYMISEYARAPGGTVSLVGYPLLGVRAKRTSIPPLGTLGLDPAWPIVGLPPKTTDPQLGCASFQLALPADPALVGVPFYLQALAEGRTPAGPTWRLTNTAADSIRK